MEVSIDFGDIKDWEAFHSVFFEVMGFPEFYGRNMDAWIECMSYVDDTDAGMSTVTVEPEESLEMVILGVEEAIKTCPDVFQGFMECVAFVNHRFIDSNSSVRLKVVAI